MFEHHPEAAQLKDCRPDPEEQLQTVRRRTAVIDEGMQLLLRLTSLPLPFHDTQIEQAVAAMLGKLVVEKEQLKAREQRILTEINEEAAGANR